MMRPHPAEWFQIVVAKDDAVLLLEDLANSGCIELEAGKDTAPGLSEELQRGFARFDALAQRFSNYWPEAGTVARPVEVHEMVERGLAVVEAWSAAATGPIASLQALEAERSSLRLWRQVLQEVRDGTLDFSALVAPGKAVESALFVFPEDAAPALPQAALGRRLKLGPEAALLAVGPPDALDAITRQALSAQGKRIEMPAWARGKAGESLAYASSRLAATDEQLAAARTALERLSARLHLGEALGWLRHAQWMARSVGEVRSGEHFCRITGWTDDRGRLKRALAASGARALAGFPAPPRGVQAPLLLQNPWWARPFEVFSRALGMPARYAADPSMLLAVIVPLLFGYMFGDVGQGAILVAAGLLLRKRVPMLGMLIAGGVSAMLFGLFFGSLFGLHGIVSALWLMPLEDPLPVLVMPLAGGAVLLLLGLVINALEAYWRGKLRHWLVTDAGLIAVYLGILAGFLHAAGYAVAAAGVLLAVAGRVALTRRLRPALGAAGELLEKTLQLLINTLSFVRVGAFALAHAGLSAAIIALAGAATSTAGHVTVMVLGNIAVIVVEALVVSIQTTRLVLFEFFTRFFVSKGREFHPLSPPVFVRGELHEPAS
ncbi:MAG: ATPase [Betaproteobacteria bacterium]|nr:ATPase [Betaproteobacteria bacterium]